MKVWIQCQTTAEAEFFVQAVLEGYFGCPLVCQISPLNPCSVDVNLRSHPIDDERLQKIPFLVDWDYYGDEFDVDQTALICATHPLPPDLRRGVLLPMRGRKMAN